MLGCRAPKTTPLSLSFSVSHRLDEGEERKEELRKKGEKEEGEEGGSGSFHRLTSSAPTVASELRGKKMAAACMASPKYSSLINFLR